MNRYLFEQMMQRMGSQKMNPPSADYAPGGAMFPIMGQNNLDIKAPAPTTKLGTLADFIVPNTRAAFAGKGGANGG